MSSGLVEIIEETIGRLQLDLSGLRVLTEAATGHFAMTAALAARADGQVLAFARDSAYGSRSECIDATASLARRLGVEARIRFIEDRADEAVAGCDVVTNTGHLRPLDRDLLERVGSQACVPYMAENWEVRPGDVDLEWCASRGIPVYFTDEDAWDMGVFSMCGPLALKMCGEAGAHLRGARVLVISSDRFAPVLANALREAGAQVEVHAPGSRIPEGPWEIVVVAEYVSKRGVIGTMLATDELLHQLAPSATLVQFAGSNQVESLVRSGHTVWPPDPLPPQRMARTLAWLGPLPVARLLGMGLKVGEAAVRGRRAGLRGEHLDRWVLENAPAQLPLDRA